MRRLLKVTRSLPKDSLQSRQLYSLIELRAVGWDWDDPISLDSMTLNGKTNAAPSSGISTSNGLSGYESIAPYNSMAGFDFGQSEMDDFITQE